MKSGKTVMAVLAGVGAGVALGYWFASERNDKLRKKIRKALTNASEDVMTKVMNEFEEIKTKGAELKEKGVTMKDKIMYALSNMKEDAKQRVHDFIESTQKESNKVQNEAKNAVKQT